LIVEILWIYSLSLRQAVLLWWLPHLRAWLLLLMSWITSCLRSLRNLILLLNHLILHICLAMTPIWSLWSINKQAIFSWKLGCIADKIWKCIFLPWRWVISAFSRLWSVIRRGWMPSFSLAVISYRIRSRLSNGNCSFWNWGRILTNWESILNW